MTDAIARYRTASEANDMESWPLCWRRTSRIAPHLRPWLALTLFALVLGPKVARHPGIARRALAG